MSTVIAYTRVLELQAKWKHISKNNNNTGMKKITQIKRFATFEHGKKAFKQ